MWYGLVVYIQGSLNRSFLVWDLDLVFSKKLLSCVKQRTAQPGILMFQGDKKRNIFPQGKGKEKLKMNFFLNVLIFIYLAILDLSCSMQDLVPRPEIEPGPSALGV